MLYYEVTAYICNPQSGEYTGLHSSGPVYIVENGVSREIEIGDCFLSRARSPAVPGNPVGNILGYDVVWKAVSRQWNSVYNASNAGPRQHASCCDYWLCSVPESPTPCTYHIGIPIPGSWKSEVDCLANCSNDPHFPAAKPAGVSKTVFTGDEPCLDVKLCPCGWDYQAPPGHNGAWPDGSCTSPDFGTPNNIGNQITGTTESKCITIDGNLPKLNDVIPLTTAGSIAPGITASNGPVGTANGGFITHDSSYIVRKLPSSHNIVGNYNSVSCNSMFPYNPYVPTPQNEKIINSFTIDDGALSAVATKRSFTVSGDTGAVFSLTIRNSADKYYNFVTNAFQTAATKLAQQKIDFTGRFNSSVIFPTVVSNDVYDIELFSEVGHNTILSKDTIFNSTVDTGTSNNLVLKKTITQSTSTTMTISLRSPSNSAYYSTLPDAVTAVLSPSSISDVNTAVNFSWDVTLSSRNFSLTRPLVLTDFETDRSDIYTTNGTGSSATALILDDISRLETGMTLTAIESGSVSGSPVISSINITTKTVTLSVAQSWADNKEITFTDVGNNGFFNFFDSNSSLDRPTTAIADVTTTTTADTTGSPNVVVAVASANGLKASITQTTSGEVEESNTLTLVSITGCWIGQYLVNISSGMVNASIRIIDINTTLNLVTFSETLTIGNGVTLTFANSTVTGIGITVDSDYPNVPVYISNISTLNLTTSAIQALENGTTLTFSGNSRSATITGTMNVESLSTTDFTTYLNLDNILYVTA